MFHWMFKQEEQNKDTERHLFKWKKTIAAVRCAAKKWMKRSNSTQNPSRLSFGKEQAARLKSTQPN